MAKEFWVSRGNSYFVFVSANAVALKFLIDAMSSMTVFSGTFFYSLMRVGFRINTPETAGYIEEGAVALGWLGFFIGMFGIFNYNGDFALSNHNGSETLCLRCFSVTL